MSVIKKGPPQSSECEGQCIMRYAPQRSAHRNGFMRGSIIRVLIVDSRALATKEDPPQIKYKRLGDVTERNKNTKWQNKIPTAH